MATPTCRQRQPCIIQASCIAVRQPDPAVPCTIIWLVHCTVRSSVAPVTDVTRATAPRTQPPVAERALTSYNALLPVVYPTQTNAVVCHRRGFAARVEYSDDENYYAGSVRELIAASDSGSYQSRLNELCCKWSPGIRGPLQFIPGC